MSRRRTQSEVWPMTFRAEGAGPPAAIRVRRLLKAALRGYGLRCVSLCGPDAVQHGKYGNRQAAARGVSITGDLFSNEKRLAGNRPMEVQT
jgi:hypothetical protein